MSKLQQNEARLEQNATVTISHETGHAAKRTAVPALPALTHLMIECTSQRGWCREGELNPQGAKHRRILSTEKGSEPFGKFSTLLYFFNPLQDRRFAPF
jgi:hypothetical protein